MGTESNAKATTKVVKLNKALKLAEAWVSSMSGSTTRGESNQLEFVGRPARLGLGAKETLSMKAAASTDPVERKLLGKLNAGKKLSSKGSRKGSPAEESGSSGEDDDEPESRTNSFAKKRALPLVASPQLKRQK